MVNYDNALKPGTVLQGVEHSYRIKQVLGQGSFGITYLAYTSVSVCGQLGKVKTEIPVAIKEFFMHDVNGREGTMVTLGSKGGLFGDYRRKFTHEARNLGRLQHPGIVQVIEIFEANGTSYFSMEYCEGGSLDALIARQGCIRESEAIRLFGQIASALTYMHSQGMLHLDVKPGNIMLRGDGEAVLIDFGLSKQYDENGEPESSTTIRCGTPRYAPFEQVNYQERKGKFPVTMDVYALGATLYKMLTGERPPFPADLLDGFPEQSLRSHGISDHTIACIRRAMSPRVADRYQSVPDFASALQDDATVVEDVKPPKPPVYVEPKQQPRSPAVEMQPNVDISQDDESKSKKWLWLLLKVAVAVVVVVLMTMLFKRGSNVEPPAVQTPQNIIRQPESGAVLPPLDEASLNSDDTIAVSYSSRIESEEQAEPKPQSGPKKPQKEVKPEGRNNGGKVSRAFQHNNESENNMPQNPEQVYTAVEQMPAFPGGDAALMQYISTHINYPPMAMENDIQGRVIVQFVVTKTGKVGDVKVVRGVDRELDKEAVRVIKSLPDFIPGRMNGQAVSVWYTLPVTFRLQ